MTKNSFLSKLTENAPLAKLTTFGIGGPAKFFTIVYSNKELIETVKKARENKIKFFILGGGSNILVSDRGFAGLVIKINNNSLKNKGNTVTAQSGTRLSELVKFAAKKRLSGLEHLWGIPGTVGGAVVGNAGAKDCWIGQSTTAVTVLNLNNQLINLKQKDCQFAYRTSRFQNSQEIVIEAIFKLTPATPEKITQKQSFFAELKSSQPREKSAGSIFKNPPGDSAGRLIDQAGLKGQKIGGAQISFQHANFIINTNKASAQDVLALMRLVQKKVLIRFQIKLKPEIKLIGFTKSEITDII
ncbi:MAG: UDP-N-acetylmuramate dehydrogenase [Candidatus Shapirobacteria bacterium]|nr:UDP-N-acetylmuramate dehydrogenase [Candidatus Shapirobacteria bacterium]MDD5073968.1 UDP-N-acetylmuramate dehydrogenase [Candidatus Shapirobacteria bacterium]MDD5481676.1 UDP-N-acetylmuramate dehydrogenase [Candidatus Shapirobacteria bacterium]